jgi:transposase InsO family protein
MERTKGNHASRHAFVDVATRRRLRVKGSVFAFAPTSIIADLGSNFTSSEFFDFCEQRSIWIKYASVAHPRANGQVERANGMILEALTKMVFDKREKLAGK